MKHKKYNPGLTKENSKFIFHISTWHRIYRYFINFFYPNICPCCEEIIDYNDALCEECNSKIRNYDGGQMIKYADEFIAYCIYEGKVKYAVRKYKHTAQGNSYFAFAFGIIQALHRKQLFDDIDVVTYIPMTERDFKRRGYNQTLYMAQEIYYQTGLPYAELLLKIRQTESQKSLDRISREENLRGAFRIVSPETDLRGKCVLVIDDLCTTGSTLSEASRILKEAGAKKVIAAAFAKTDKYSY